MGGDSQASDSNQETAVKSITVYPDTDELEEGPQTLKPIKVSLFEIGNCVALKKRGPLGLVLRATPKDTTQSHTRFKRLGLFHINTISKGQIKEDARNSSSNNHANLFEDITQEVIEIE
ncbi:hypothetical protein F4805DRAFT_365118 [Annulohypoxylon moriforme]|nr:hypothetical protein F4805DRAFT_365118 [Annulohypoxylon moriforme]